MRKERRLEEWKNKLEFHSFVRKRMSTVKLRFLHEMRLIMAKYVISGEDYLEVRDFCFEKLKEMLR